MRPITNTYTDPLDLIWLHAAQQMGMRVERSAEVNASWDGGGVLTIGTAETLDADDCLAQMILHEACHALVEGPDSLQKLDWGLGEADKVHEHACLRLQAALADTVGMRPFFAATTVFRRYYDALPDNPLATEDDPAIAMALAAWQSATRGPWAVPLQEALSKSAAIADLLADSAPNHSLWKR